MLISMFIAASIARAADTLTRDDFHHADEVTSVFENESLDLQYDYVENLDDGRGYTAGIAGFTTGTGDLIQVVDQFLTQADGDPRLKQRWTNIYPRLRDANVDQLKDLPRLWIDSSATLSFRNAQDIINDKLNRTPALEIFRSLKLQSPLAFAVIYDTVVQHGSGESDPDGAPAIAQSATNFGDETQYLMKFLEARRAILLHPHSKETEECWRESVGRVDALEDLVQRHAFSLIVGTQVNAWGQSFTIR